MADAKTIERELLALLRGFTNHDQLYEGSKSIFDRAKAQKLTKGSKKSDPVISGPNGIRAWALKTIHGENKAEKAQIEKARVIYYAYLDAHGLKHHVNKGSGFNWERKKIGLKPVSSSGDEPAAAGSSGRGGTAAASSTTKRTRPSKDLIQARRVASKSPEELVAWSKTAQAKASGMQELTMEEAAAAIKEARKRAAAPPRMQELARRRRGDAMLGQTPPSAPASGAAKVPGPGEMGTARKKADAARQQTAVLRAYLEQNPGLKSDLARGIRSQSEVMAMAQAQAPPSEVDQQAAYRRKVLQTHWKAPSLFGHNEAGQSYLQWLRGDVPASPPTGARTGSQITPPARRPQPQAQPKKTGDLSKKRKYKKSDGTTWYSPGR